ncbi:TPA: DUF4145 domain-containing protein [Burkholderia contaminans]|uniref:DUF4145 domain-containing protein n=1 Tax=Burkholderia contaminans TaxID=488447 RepID=A0AAP4QZQ8_9BURK|nr:MULTISPECIES: DUF4145 domain-containing protein [Burkholderia]MBD1410560.1 DUF4145 domain-containing protein [Burkholderia contaminans]MBM6427352.1 DUF4145 domain-containing protein [Burkholderia contaminans]MCA7875671.1 DUF4145 domain-containing protein [Burkholderia contaminans]MDN7564371.1 DUF4145 domain-containing protein [Burkholderia contaminans]MDN8024122.1 DUF4145 domain-containing protein [Burkholderia contaminans]
MAEQEEKETVKGQCPHCGDERNCEVHGRVKKQWEWSDRSGNSVDGLIEHLFLECKGCETIFYESISCNSEDVEYWYDHNGDTQSEYVMHRTTYPKPTSRIKPSWLSAIVNTDMTLYTILDEMYLACDNGTYILTAIGLRTALDRAMEVLGIDQAATFVEKLKRLRDGGWIGETEHEILGIVTDAGNAAAHRGWRPDEQEVFQLVQAMEVFLQRAFIVGKQALGIKEKIPPKPARRK